MRQIKIVVEENPDGYVAYPIDMNGIVIGEGDSYEEALADVRSAIQFTSRPSDSTHWNRISAA